MTEQGERTYEIQRGDEDETAITLAYECSVDDHGFYYDTVLLSAIVCDTGEDVIRWFRETRHASGCTQEEWYANKIQTYLNDE